LVIDFMIELAEQLGEKDIASSVKEEALTAFSSSTDDDMQNEVPIAPPPSLQKF